MLVPRFEDRLEYRYGLPSHLLPLPFNLSGYYWSLIASTCSSSPPFHVQLTSLGILRVSIAFFLGTSFSHRFWDDRLWQTLFTFGPDLLSAPEPRTIICMPSNALNLPSQLCTGVHGPVFDNGQRDRCHSLSGLRGLAYAIRCY